MEQFDLVALQKKLSLTKTLPLIIQSDSMEPLLKVGGQYQVDDFPYDQLKVFDIIVFLQGSQLIAHFLWHFNQHEQKWQSRSLRYPHAPDCPLPRQSYLGKISRPSMTRLHRLLFTARVLWARSA